ncbi:magnesium transporter [Halanaerobium hydrogeniformans]|uniref:Magnesium transporter MgtE n=1 Tax=Halanaerobium hydrogeniformans TaxID=656519 RepID=E4RKV3_HALHG|nr:magnesium transporter [Halanaerobium hydrogeniformans]ADQ15694.1 magnesium transporter [Halanaerobium hydrogeniformans]
MLLGNEIIKEAVQKTKQYLKAKEIEKAVEVSEQLPAQRLAKLLRNFSSEHIYSFLQHLPKDRILEVINGFAEEYAAELLELMPEEERLKYLSKMDSDEVVDILNQYPREKQEKILEDFSRSKREEVENIASYSEDTVGAFLEKDFLSVISGNTIENILSEIKNLSETIEHRSYVYIVNKNNKLLGVSSFRELLFADKKAKIDSIMTENIYSANVEDPAIEAAQRLKARKLKLLPVVDKQERLVGILSMETAVELLSNEIAEDILALSGVSGEESFFTKSGLSIKMRLPWMIGNIFLNLGAVAVISNFENTIAQVAILAAFLPMITDMGGNVGIQALSVSIRSLALGEVQIRDIKRAVVKEMKIGLVNGLVLGAVFAVVAYFLQRNLILGFVAGIALGINVLVAGVVGGSMPFIIKKLGKDPALMTGPFLTTITDITGVSIYLGLSTIFLLGLL